MTNNPAREKYVTENLFKKEANKVQGEFNRIHEQFEQVNKRFEQVDKRFEQVDKRFEQIDEKFDLVHAEFKHVHKKIDNVALELVKTNERLSRVETTMATKTDTNLIVEKIDHFMKKMSIFDQEEAVQSFHLEDLRHRVDDHDKRLTALEASR